MSEETKKRTRQSKDTKEALPDSRTSLEKQITILKSLNVKSNKGSNPVNYKEVALTSGINDSLVSGALGFFNKIDLIEKHKGSKYTPSKETIDFCNTIQWGSEEEVEKEFGKLTGNTWFVKYVKDELFAVNPEVDENTLMSNLGKFSEADSDYHKGSLKRIIDYLEYGGVIVKDEVTKKYKLKNQEPISSNKTQVNPEPLHSSNLVVDNPIVPEKASPNLGQIETYLITIVGPGMNSTFEINGEDDLLILEAYLAKIRKKLGSDEN